MDVLPLSAGVCASVCKEGKKGDKQERSGQSKGGGGS